MDNRERREERGLLLPSDTNGQINVMVNNMYDDEDTIDLGRVFDNMKAKTRLFAWVLILFMVIGFCAPLVVYQIQAPMLTVSSMVNLNYTSSGLTAPDGTALDLTQITSSYVLQNALSRLNYPELPSLSSLRDNISVERILTEESRRAQELAAQMTEDKNQSAYNQAQAVALTYESRFLVTLTNGFTLEGSKKKVILSDTALCALLDSIVDSYNDYLVLTYADTKLPPDEISVIDVEHLNYLESLDLLREASDNLYAYCNDKSAEIKAYRSWKTGYSLLDLMAMIVSNRSERIDYLYSYAYYNGIERDRDSMITSYEYQLRTVETDLRALNENIATVKSILESYKNDEIYISNGEGEASQFTETPTEYFNQMYRQQMKNYETAASLEIRAEDLKHKIKTLKSIDDTAETPLAIKRQVEEELSDAVTATHEIYEMVVDFMQEQQSSSSYSHYATHTAAQGELQNFLLANLKNIVIGILVGMVLALGLWFCAGLAPEFRGDRDRTPRRREADEA